MSRRPSRTAVGREGEEAAARYLVSQGYVIIDRNVRFRTGEIDLVAKDGGTLVFVEVKTRTGPSYGTPAEAVDFRKQQQLVRLASLYIAGRNLAAVPCRFDVVGVESSGAGGWQYTLFRNAFGA